MEIIMKKKFTHTLIFCMVACGLGYAFYRFYLKDTKTTEVSSPILSLTDKLHTLINNTSMKQEETIPVSSPAITEADFTISPITEEIKARINGKSYKADCTIPYEELRYLTLYYVDFNGLIQKGEMIVNKAIAQDVVEIFYALYTAKYPIEQMKLVDEFDADDEKSMAANNTSCFNYRTIAGTTRISNHAKGLAIDVNPLYNPYVRSNSAGETEVLPANGTPYVDRSQGFAYKIDTNDLCYQEFIKHGFSWGGAWNYSKDYQHFEKK